jgi:predicted nucleotidyltransferase
LTNTLLNVSKSIEAVLRHHYGEIAEVCAGVGVEFLVVGATARDLVMHYGHGAPIRRATTDIDVAVLVANWGRFGELQEALVACGYTKSKAAQRFFSPTDTPVDIVPFGAVADASSTILWPPAGDTTMSVLGFMEAHEHADIVRIQESPAIDIRVATPVGLTLLKLMAWRDRSPDVRSKDAVDLRYLLDYYDRIPEVSDTLYSDAELGERYSWDTELMAAELLGQRVREITGTDAAQVILSLTGDPQTLDTLVLEMSAWKEHAIERSGTLLDAFSFGFSQ